jgi:opacity protein-like surface antigen
MKNFALMALVAILAGGSALAAETPVLDKREANQEKRIEQGKASGELTNREAARLEHAEDRLATNEAKAKADGTVTAKERARLRTEARNNSKRIAKQKHDAQTKR